MIRSPHVIHLLTQSARIIFTQTAEACATTVLSGTWTTFCDFYVSTRLLDQGSSLSKNLSVKFLLFCFPSGKEMIWALKRTISLLYSGPSKHDWPSNVIQWTIQTWLAQQCYTVDHPNMIGPAMLYSGPSKHDWPSNVIQWTIQTWLAQQYYSLDHPNMIGPALLYSGPFRHDWPSNVIQWTIQTWLAQQCYTEDHSNMIGPAILYSGPFKHDDVLIKGKKNIFIQGFIKVMMDPNWNCNDFIKFIMSRNCNTTLKPYYFFFLAWVIPLLNSI